MKAQIWWSLFLGTWGIFIGFAVWAAREHGVIRDRIATIDKEQSVQLMKIETELKQVNLTLIRIQKELEHSKE